MRGFPRCCSLSVFTQYSSAEPHEEQQDHRAHPEPLRAGRGGDDGDERRADEGGGAPGEREEAEGLGQGDPALRLVHEKRPRGRLQRPRRRAEKAPRHHEDDVGKPRVRANGQAEDAGARGEERDAADPDQHEDGGDDDRPRPEGPVGPAARPGADRADAGGDDPEDAELEEAPAEDAGGVDAAEGEERGQRVAVDHRGDEEGEEAPVAGREPEGRAEVGEAGAEEAGGAPRRLVGGVEEEGQREDQVPDGREGPGGARRLAEGGVEAEDGRDPEQRRGAARGGREEEKDEDERDEPAEVAERPARARDAADLRPRAEAGEHGVDEDLAELGADEGDGVDDDDRLRARHAGRRQPEAGAAEDEGHREGEDPPLARAGAVGHGAEEGREDGDDRPATAAAAPQSAWPRTGSPTTSATK